MITPIDFMKLSPAKAEEKKYMFPESINLEKETAFFGYLRGDFKGDENFRYHWFDGFEKRRDDKFMNEFNSAVDLFRYDPQYKGILGGLESMTALCMENPSAEMPGSLKRDSYGFRLDSTVYSYLIRCSPKANDYNFYVYSYEKESLNQHIEKARDGIRFITPEYSELFKIRDGGKILITGPGGEKAVRKCRYVDEWHVEVGFNLYHIAEFADIMKDRGNTVRAYDETKTQKKIQEKDRWLNGR